MQKVIISWKEIGETPFERLEKERLSAGIPKDTPMTYAGRLDPLAEGVLPILGGDECKNREKYLGLDKEYEIEILFGVKTDSGDGLGLIEKVDTRKVEKIDFSKYCGKFEQKYPAYSSKTIKGKHLHEYARSGFLPEEIPVKQVEIYKIAKIGESEIGGSKLAEFIIERVKKVRGDFRQEKIIQEWEKFSKNSGSLIFKQISLKVFCSSGTYMRSLAERMGEGEGSVGMATAIKRTKVGSFII